MRKLQWLWNRGLWFHSLALPAMITSNILYFFYSPSDSVLPGFQTFVKNRFKADWQWLVVPNQSLKDDLERIVNINYFRRCREAQYKSINY